ncbi:MAG: hypothetical protein MZV70_63105 [Desulfobacterales bacterium]|nr:hypothetical protein [Desulfobacterales bacterium]
MHVLTGLYLFLAEPQGPAGRATRTGRLRRRADAELPDHALHRHRHPGLRRLSPLPLHLRRQDRPPPSSTSVTAAFNQPLIMLLYAAADDRRGAARAARVLERLPDRSAPTTPSTCRPLSAAQRRRGRSSVALGFGLLPLVVAMRY